MAIEFDKLSSEELFELARQRQVQEQESAQRAAAAERIGELQKQRDLLVSKHNETLAATDKVLNELQQKRKKLLDEHEAALLPIDQELRQLSETATEQKSAEKSAPAAPPKPPTPTPAPAQTPPAAAAPERPAPPSRPAMVAVNTSDELFDHVRELMLGRTYISESLLKEQLRSRSVTVSNLHKLLEQLVKDGRLANKGGGNYALGRKA